MKNINAPLKKFESGSAVANLQYCLILLLEKAPTFAPVGERPALISELKRERAAEQYGPGTAKAVHLFQVSGQKQFQLRPTGDVDEATAAALNSALKPLGAFDEDVESAPDKPSPDKPKDATMPIKPTPSIPTTDTPMPNPTKPTTETTTISSDFHVKGKVQWVDETSAIGTVVRAFDKDLRHEQLLGEAALDSDGNYDITYTSEQFVRAEKKSADLIVRAFSPSGAQIATSQVVHNAKPVEIIDLLLGGAVMVGPSEYTRLAADVEPLLDGATVAELTDSDADFLSHETTWSKGYLGFYATAAQLSQQTKIPTEVFYGFARKNLPLNLKSLVALGPDVQRKALEAALKENIIPAVIGLMIESILSSLSKLDIPSVTPSMKLEDLSEVISLDGAVLQKLKEKNLNIEHVGEATLASLVNDKIITPAQKKELHNTISLLKLSGENVELTKAVKDTIKESPVELVSMGKADWLKVMQDKQIKLPVGETSLESYAENLRNVVEQSFPSEYFLHRVIKGDAPQKTSAILNNIAPLLKNNKTVIPTDDSTTGDIDWKGISADKKQKIQASLSELTPLVNSYRSLGVADILNHPELTPDQKQATVEKRFASLNTFYTNNPNIDLNTADFATSNTEKNTNNLNMQGVDASDQPFVKKQMAATQRVFTMTENHETGDLLMKKGFDSGSAIMAMTEVDFIKETGLGWEVAKPIFAKAQDLAVGSAHYFEAIRDIVRGDFRRVAVSNQDSALVNDLREIDGYSELFGSQNYCDCEACRSILSPAAYFVDLMLFVNQNISKKVFIAPGHAGHPLYLKNRRPDLWTLKLNCENTNKEIPYLQVVNEVLEKYLTRAVPTTDVYETLRLSNLSCSQPFNLRLEETRLYLSHFGLKLYDVYKALNASKSEQDREYLLLSPEELTIITTDDPQGAAIRFGNVPLTDFNVQEFIRYAGITRSQLDDLLSTEFSSAIVQVLVKTVKLSTDIQQYNEVLTGLTPTNLDEIHRYIRLWKKTDWTLREFDLLLCSLKAKLLLLTFSNTQTDGYPKVLQLADIRFIQKTLGLSVEEMATLIYQLPQIALIDKQRPMYDRIFNLEKIFGVASTDSNGVKTFNTTVNLLADKALDTITFPIIAGLGVTVSEFQMLLILLDKDPTVDIAIEINLLSDLYRQVAIARGLKVTIKEYVNLIDLVLNGAAVADFSQIRKLIEFRAWQKTSPYSIDEISFIIRGTESTEVKYANNLESLSKAIVDIQTHAEADGEAIVGDDEKKSKIIESRDKYLRAYLLKTLNVTSVQLNVLFSKLFSLNITSSTIITAVSVGLEPASSPLSASDLNTLLTFVQKLERYSLLLTKAQYDPGMISFLLQNNEVYGITDLTALVATDLINITRYYELINNSLELRTAFNAALQHISVSNNVVELDNSVLAKVLKQEESLVVSITALLSTWRPPSPVLNAIHSLQTCLDYCNLLGVQGDSLKKMIQSDPIGLPVARNVIVNAFSAKYPEEKIRNEKLESYNDKLNTIKRDALCDYIISKKDTFKFQDRGDLYSFFLLDVEMSGCFRTSYLVAAITSLQLYIHRSLINLEQSSESLNPNIVNVSVPPRSIPRDEWDWRKNYRVWEANRKVFLYPENYIDPTLRDNKSEIFKILEDELLQQKIDSNTAETAYKKYLSGFTELTRLRYAGGYYHQISNVNGFLQMNMQDVGGDSYFYINETTLKSESDESHFYLFGRTNVDPYQYYYRTYNHHTKVWSNWKTIDLGIEASEISAVIHRGKLYIYWTEVQAKEVTKIEGGTSKSEGVVFKIYVKYSFRDENGKWSAPQRLYIGQQHVAEGVIYNRVWKGENLKNEVKERVHDITLEKFQKLVYRKPYASLYNDISQPISLHHIWSHGKTSTQAKYITHDSVEHAHNWWAFIPSQSFNVVNDDYNIPAVVDSTNVEIFVALSGWHKYPGVATFQIIDSIHCNINVQSKAYDDAYPPNHFNYDFTVSLSRVSNSIGSDVRTNATHISLSRNIVTNLTQEDLLKHAPHISSLSALEQEYNLAYHEDDSIGLFVENGTKLMTDHIIKQTTQNDANLIIKKGSTLENVMLSTILTEELSDILFAKGLEDLLSLKTQLRSDVHRQQLDFRGAYGEYYWEMFFHVPFIIADHLNANQKFKEAKWWYERIFDPTANADSTNQQDTDRNWQFKEFRNLDIQKLKDMLCDLGAITAYKKDPFNPHAIARLRLSAYQKSIVMHYIDNLLDWGDFLFTQDTRESINEAEMLYQVAFDILGKRPIKVGKCETVDENALTYAAIEPQFGNGSEFLIQLENYYGLQRRTYGVEQRNLRASKNLGSITAKRSNTQLSLVELQEKSPSARMPLSSGQNKAVQSDASQVSNARPYLGQMKSYNIVNDRAIMPIRDNSQWNDTDKFVLGKDSNDRFSTGTNNRAPGYELTKQYSLVFCVPPNLELMKYWDRVEDRLFKIRNCMNIKGMRRSLSLFQPPIDPMLLVRARAAGLSLEDIAMMFGGGSPVLPVYRFTYLVEKAKQFAQTVQSFGSALLSALEKKDGEELMMIRSIHEKNILKLTKDVKRKQLKDSQFQYSISEAALVNVQNRVDYYRGLIDTGLIPGEVTEQVSKMTAAGIRATEATLGFLSSVFGILPELGAPMAMKYGGVALSAGTKNLQDATGCLAVIADNVAIMAGIEASNQRRKQDWDQQLILAQQEYKQSNIQLLAAEIRQQIAEQDLAIHEKTMDQTDEVYQFNKNKFTNLSLFNYLASTLNRLHRTAYNIALDLAKQAESAFQFETGDTEFFIQPNNWETNRAGLLSGESLILQLQQLEKKFMDGNKRRPEITQTFSLASLSPKELLTLRQKGKCTIDIPELAFDILYPGQYRRRIKSVRITIPSIVGPYTNVSAKLSLGANQFKDENGSYLSGQSGESISASSANNDTGMFDFNFKDERYLPFEGAGAISNWTLDLPSTFRSFNYDTIGDVLLHISYTSFEGNRTAGETALEDLVTDLLVTSDFYRLVSLKHEFPDALYQLLSPNSQGTTFNITSDHFPYLFSSKTLTMISGWTVYVKPKKNMAIPTTGAPSNVNWSVTIDDIQVTWSSSLDIQTTLNGTEIDKVKVGEVVIDPTPNPPHNPPPNLNPIREWKITAMGGTIDKTNTEDVLILIHYKAS